MKTIDQLPENPVAQPVVFPGYMVVTAECGACGSEIIGVAPVGVEGLTCPNCHAVDDTFAWVPDERSTLSHDGAWLTGELDFTERTWFHTASGNISVLWNEAEEDDEIERIALPLWLVRLIAFAVGLRNLFHAVRS